MASCLKAGSLASSEKGLVTQSGNDTLSLQHDCSNPLFSPALPYTDMYIHAGMLSFTYMRKKKHACTCMSTYVLFSYVHIHISNIHIYNASLNEYIHTCIKVTDGVPAPICTVSSHTEQHYIYIYIRLG